MPVPQSSIGRGLGANYKQNSAFALAGKKQGSGFSLVPRERVKTLARSEETAPASRFSGTVYEEARPVRGATYFDEKPNKANTSTVVCLYNEVRMRRCVYGISASNTGTSNAINTSSFATRFARCRRGSSSSAR